jgi:hypothetical protein
LNYCETSIDHNTFHTNCRAFCPVHCIVSDCVTADYLLYTIRKVKNFLNINSFTANRVLGFRTQKSSWFIAGVTHEINFTAVK